MPKRRLGYGEVVAEEGAAPPSRSKKSPGSPPTQEKNPGSNRPQPRRKTAEILLKLSHSCNLHLRSCHNEKNSNASIVDDDERVPLRCQNDLENLGNLLPQIELKFRPPEPGDEGPSAEDVVHLCAFYNSTMQSLYCPYAPRLFEQGKSTEHGKVILSCGCAWCSDSCTTYLISDTTFCTSISHETSNVSTAACNYPCGSCCG